MNKNDEQTAAFEKAKNILTSPIVIAYYQPGAPLQLFTDASLKNGLGFYLKQQQSDNTWKTIQTGSRTLTPAETRYAPIELELQAIVYATKKCHNFLAGTAFNLFTDHRPLVSICNKRRLDDIGNSRILRSLLKLMDYNFTVNYIPGSQNKVADSFLRNPVDQPDTNDENHETAQTFLLRACRTSQAQTADCSFRLEQIKKVADTDLEYQLLKSQIHQGFPQNKHNLPELLYSYWNIRNELLISDDDFILKGTRLLVPKDLRKCVLSDLHDGHRGIEGTKARARLIVFWPGIDNDISNKCRSCPKCEFDRPSNNKEPIKHLPVPEYPFQIISADWFDLNSEKFLVIVDWYSGYFDVKGPVTNPDAGTVITCLREWFINNAVCDVFWSDGGPPFGSSNVNDFLKRWGVEWRPSSPYYPQGNSVAESAVKWAKSLLRKCWRGRGQPLRTNEEWIKGILQWKNTPHKSTGLSPAIMLYGHPVQDIIPCHKSSLSRSWHDEKLRVDKEAAKRKEKLEKYCNRGTKTLEQLKINDPVCVQNTNTKKWDR